MEAPRTQDCEQNLDDGCSRPLCLPPSLLRQSLGQEGISRASLATVTALSSLPRKAQRRKHWAFPRSSHLLWEKSPVFPTRAEPKPSGSAAGAVAALRLHSNCLFNGLSPGGSALDCGQCELCICVAHLADTPSPWLLSVPRRCSIGFNRMN